MANKAITIKPDEDKEVQEAQIAVGKKYYLTPKYMLWKEYFLDRSNKETYGNATVSACYAYSLDKTDPKAYNVAAQIGYTNVKKHKSLAREYWERNGLTHGKLLNLYNDVMVQRRDVNMLYSVARVMDLELPKYENVTQPKIFNTQQNNQLNVNAMQITFTEMESK